MRDAFRGTERLCRSRPGAIGRGMRRLALALCQILVALPAAARDPDRLSFLIASRHVDARSAFQEVNPGVILTWEGRPGLSLAGYYNSYGRLSVAAAVTWPVFERGELQVDLFAGGAWYPRDGRRFAAHLGDVVPIGGVQARWRNAFVQVIPSDGVETDAIVGFGVTFEVPR